MPHYSIFNYMLIVGNWYCEICCSRPSWELRAGRLSDNPKLGQNLLITCEYTESWKIWSQLWMCAKPSWRLPLFGTKYKYKYEFGPSWRLPLFGANSGIYKSEFLSQLHFFAPALHFTYDWVSFQISVKYFQLEEHNHKIKKHYKDVQQRIR